MKILNATEYLKANHAVVLRVSWDAKTKSFLAILSMGVDGEFLAYERARDVLSAILRATDYAQGYREPFTVGGTDDLAQGLIEISERGKRGL